MLEGWDGGRGSLEMGMSNGEEDCTHCTHCPQALVPRYEHRGDLIALKPVSD